MGHDKGTGATGTDHRRARRHRVAALGNCCDGVIGDHHNSNTELIAQGVANLASPIFGGIPATGAIARTMTNINNGGKSPIAGIIHAVVLLLIFLFFMPLAKYIPMACLAGVLVIVSYGMCGWRSFLSLMKNPKSDVTVLLITFFLTIIFDLTVAIEVGLIIACLLFMKRVSEVTDVKLIENEINEESDMIKGNLEHLTIRREWKCMKSTVRSSSVPATVSRKSWQRSATAPRCAS